jgi:nucleotide-binding universal stress UspA family protein
VKIETILVPTDFSKDAEHALAIGVEFAKSFGGKIIVLHAYRIDVPMASPAVGGGFVLPEGFYDELYRQASAEVEKLAKNCSDQGVEARGIAVSDRPSAAIVDEARRSGADLIVMGTRGLTGLKHVALGSIAERVVRTAACPVLTVKAPS